MTAPRMTVAEALAYADEWVRGMTFHAGSEGWRVVCKVLADEVQRLHSSCPRCGGAMKPGKAIEQAWTAGTPDFIDSECVTMSPGGPGRLVDCMKCGECGYSVA